jgi:hypothetical protein
MTELSTAEVARDLATLWQILPGATNPARLALQQIEAQLNRRAPDLTAALALAAEGLGAPDDDDAEERALLAAVHRLLTPAVWRPHTGDACPVPTDAPVLADLGEGDPILERAGALAWGPGLGPAGEGRVQRYQVLPCAQA